MGVEEKVMQDKKQRREEDMTLLLMVEVEKKVMKDKNRVTKTPSARQQC